MPAPLPIAVLSIVAVCQDEVPALAPVIAEPVNTSLHVPLNQPLLVEHSGKNEFKLTLEIAKKRVEHSLVEEFTDRFIDEYTELNDDREVATRHILQSRRMSDGRIADPPSQGMTLEFRRVGTDTNLQVQGDRLLPKEKLQELLGLFDALWIWAKFPDQLKVGDRFDLDLRYLAPILLGGEFDYDSCPTQLVFESHDPATSLAVYAGRGRVVGKLDEEKMAGTVTSDGDCRIVVHLAEQRIDTIDFAGSMQFDGRVGNVTGVRGTGSCRCTLKTRLEPNASRLRAVRPEFRKREFQSRRHKVMIELPSSWAEFDNKESSYQLVRTLDAEKGEADLSFQVLQTSSADPKTFLGQIDDEFRKENIKAEFKDVSCPLGKGRATIVDKEEAGRKKFVRSEFYPHDGVWLVYKLSGDAEACKAALKEYEAARKTLKPSKEPPQ